MCVCVFIMLLLQHIFICVVIACAFVLPVNSHVRCSAGVFRWKPRVNVTTGNMIMYLRKSARVDRAVNGTLMVQLVNITTQARSLAKMLTVTVHPQTCTKDKAQPWGDRCV
jgi:hypothetical protein